MRRWATKGSGNLEGGGVGEKGGAGKVSSQATWDRGGRILSKLGGFQVSRKGSKGGQSKVSKGRLKQGEAPYIIVHCKLYLCLCIYGMLETCE